MRILNHLFQIFYDDGDALGGPGGSTQSDLDILNTPDEPAETAETPEDTETEEDPGEVTFDEPVEEESTEEAKEKGDKPAPKPGAEDPEDETVPVGQLRFKDVKAKYPTVFKDFPQLATAIRNDRAYSEVFSSPEDARDAAKVASYFNQLETNIMSGSAKELLTDIKQGNSEAYKKLVRDFLPTVKADSMELYAELTLPAVNDVLRSALRDAEGSENVNLRNAALHIAKYLYGKPEIPNLGEKQTAPNPEEEKLKQQRQQFWQEKAADFTNECFSNGRDETMAEIAKGIDNDKSISPFLKSTLKDKIFTEVDELLGKDIRHVRQMNALWKRAEASGFPKESRRQIIDAYLRGAKALIPSVKQKLRTEAGLVQPTNTKTETTPKRTVIPASGRQASGQAAKVPSARDVNWGKTSDLDFLNGKYTPKRRSK
jgi:hypothetical protein